jgi:hypothetical protein
VCFDRFKSAINKHKITTSRLAGENSDGIQNSDGEVSAHKILSNFKGFFKKLLFLVEVVGNPEVIARWSVETTRNVQ